MKVSYNKGMGYPIEISDGKTATCISIDDAKELQASLLAVIEQAETPEPELTEFEQEVRTCVTKNLTTHIKDGNGNEMSSTVFIDDDTTKKLATELLDLARKEIEEELKEKVLHDYWRQASDQCIQARKEAKAEAMNDLPQWRKWGNGACGNGRGIPLALVVRAGKGYELVDALGIQGEKYIMLSDLEKLPGFKED